MMYGCGCQTNYSSQEEMAVLFVRVVVAVLDNNKRQQRALTYENLSSHWRGCSYLNSIFPRFCVG